MVGKTIGANQASKETFMRRAIELAYEGMNGGHGGPFGAVVVTQGRIDGEGHNQVLSSNDPTAHAEVMAIRAASSTLARFDLSDCEIYVNGLPCPMCMAAIYWSRIGALYYACLPEDAEAIGFDDQEIYRELGRSASARCPPNKWHRAMTRPGPATMPGSIARTGRRIDRQIATMIEEPRNGSQIRVKSHPQPYDDARGVTARLYDAGLSRLVQPYLVLGD